MQEAKQPYRFATSPIRGITAEAVAGLVVRWFFQFIERRPRGGSEADGRGHSAGSLVPTESRQAYPGTGAIGVKESGCSGSRFPVPDTQSEKANPAKPRPA